MYILYIFKRYKRYKDIKRFARRWNGILLFSSILLYIGDDILSQVEISFEGFFV